MLTGDDLRNADALGLAAQGLSRNHEDEVMKIEAGKFYRTRDGQKEGPMLPYTFADKGPDRAFIVVEGDGRLWGEDGKSTLTEVSDLIAEWQEAPAIDWEVRRWEAMLAALTGLASNCDDAGTSSWLPEPLVGRAVEIADALIAAARVQP